MRADSFMNFWVDQMILAFIYVPNKRASALFVCTVYEILMRLLQRYKPNDKFSISDFAFHNNSHLIFLNIKTVNFSFFF